MQYFPFRHSPGERFHEEDRGAKKLDYIDALRGWAFLGVLACHVATKVLPIDVARGRILTLMQNGDKGVQLFFIVSAMTLFLSMDSRRNRERRPTRNFFIRRFFRIAPLFYAGALFYWFFSRLFLAGDPGIDVGAIAATLAFVHHWKPSWMHAVVPGGWSVGVEMTFYLFVPTLFARIKGVEAALRLSLVMQVIGVFATTVLEASTASPDRLQPNDTINYAYFWLPNQMTAFGAGIALYYLLHDRLRGTNHETEPSEAIRKRSAWSILASILLFIACALQGPGPYLSLPLFDAILCLFVYGLALHPYGAFVNPVIRWIGVRSFSAYITHFAALDWVSHSLILRADGRFASSCWHRRRWRSRW